MKRVHIKNLIIYNNNNPIILAGYGTAGMNVVDSFATIYPGRLWVYIRRDLTERKSISYNRMILNKLESAARKVFSLIIK